MSRVSLLARAGALSLATALTLMTAPAQAAPADTSATWLDRQVNDGVVHNGQYDFDDIGLTIDTGFALQALGGHATELRAMRKAVASQVASYTASGEDVYAGPAAKAVVWAQTVNANPRRYGGVDLVQQLEGTVASNGRISDRSQWGDYANVVGQAYAARGLALAGSSDRHRARRFLLQQQCSAGYFRVNFTQDKSAADQSCDGGDKATTSAPDTDATALALLQLSAIPRKGAVVKQAIRKGVNWLARTQRANGSHGGGSSTAAVNTNSTGLAAAVLGSHGKCAKAKAAAGWVLKLQARGTLNGTKLRGQRGAIAYNRAAYRRAAEEGITREVRDQWRRATAQAGPGLKYLKGCR